MKGKERRMESGALPHGKILKTITFKFYEYEVIEYKDTIFLYKKLD